MSQYPASEMESTGQVSLIEVFYKDSAKIESFIAQKNFGALRSLKYSQTTSQGHNTAVEAGIPQIVKGNVAGSESEGKAMERTYEPHDDQIIELLDYLGLEIYNSLPESCYGKLTHLRGEVSIRNMRDFSKILPEVAKNPTFFGVDKKTAQQLSNSIGSLSKILPMGIEMEVFMEDNNVIRGPLKEEFLKHSHGDILRTYGAQLPGFWHVLGVVDDANGCKGNRSTNGLRSGLDTVSDLVIQSYNEGTSGFVVIPILIFRELIK